MRKINSSWLKEIRGVYLGRGGELIFLKQGHPFSTTKHFPCQKNLKN